MKLPPVANDRDRITNGQLAKGYQTVTGNYNIRHA